MMKKIKPILFNTAMVQAIFSGRKTQTRRIVDKSGRENDPDIICEGITELKTNAVVHFRRTGQTTFHAGYKSNYQIGDILWVRETYFKTDQETCIYKANYSEGVYSHSKNKGLWKPSIFMPKSAARIFLEITGVRIERLQDISESDAINEGITEARWTNGWKNYLKHDLYLSKDKIYDNYPAAVYSYATLWESINGKDSWNLNPWVWVYEFKVVDKPKNFI